MTDKKEKRGGARAGAGRKKGSSVYGESTQAMRVPTSLVPVVTELLEFKKEKMTAQIEQHDAVLLPLIADKKLSLPLFGGRVAAGFPTAAEDHIDRYVDLNEMLIDKPASTFLVRVEGESMIGAGINPDDLLIVDRSMQPRVGKVVVCALDGELTVKRLRSKEGGLVLAPENPEFTDIPLNDSSNVVIWGVVTQVIHSV